MSEISGSKQLYSTEEYLAEGVQENLNVFKEELVSLIENMGAYDEVQLATVLEQTASEVRSSNFS